MNESTTTQRQAADDLEQLEFTPVSAEDAADLDDRVYLFGVRAEGVRS